MLYPSSPWDAPHSPPPPLCITWLPCNQGHPSWLLLICLQAFSRQHSGRFPDAFARSSYASLCSNHLLPYPPSFLILDPVPSFEIPNKSFLLSLEWIEPVVVVTGVSSACCLGELVLLLCDKELKLSPSKCSWVEYKETQVIDLQSRDTGDKLLCFNMIDLTMRENSGTRRKGQTGKMLSMTNTLGGL